MASTSPIPERELTPEELVDLEIPDEVRISPSGEKAVYSASPMGRKGEHKVSTIWIAQIGREKSARPLTSGLYNDRMPQWSPDGQSVAFLSDRSDHGKSCAIYIININGGEAHPISKAEKEREISAFAWSPNGSFIAFLSPDEKTAEKKAKEKEKDDVMEYGEDWEYNRLRLLHLATREVKDLYSEDAHVKAFTWSEDSKQIAYVLQETPEEESAYAKGVTFETLSVTNNTKTGIARFPGNIKGPIAWLSGDLFFLAGTEPNKCSTSSLVYKISLKSKEWAKHLQTNAEQCVVGLCQNGRLTTIKVESGLFDQLHVLDNEAIPRNVRLFSQQNEISSWDIVQTTDGNYVLAIVRSSFSVPRDLYSIQLNTTYELIEGSVKLSHHGEPICARFVGSFRSLRCTSLDGTTGLDGLFLSPSPSLPRNNLNREPHPTVVLIHGGPYYRLTDSFNTPVFHWSPYLLSSAKYGILLPNYRGGSGHGERFARHARGGVGTVDYDDVIALVDDGIKQGLVDPAQILVGGWSQGGFLSYLLAVRRNSQTTPGSNWKIKGAICGAGVTDWDMMSMTSDFPTFEAELAGMAPWQVGRDKGKDDTSGRQGSAIWEMKGQDVPPVLILHGEKDERVPLTQAIAFRRGCQFYRVPFEMAVYPREGHPIRERAHLIDMLKRVRRFVDMCLG